MHKKTVDMCQFHYLSPCAVKSNKMAEEQMGGKLRQCGSNHTAHAYQPGDSVPRGSEQVS